MQTLIIYEGIKFRAYNHLIAASEDGQILRIAGLRLLEPKIRQDGYATVSRRLLCHRIVATCWVHGPAEAKHVHHINGIKTDNRASNLEWVTPKTHMRERHKDVHGKHTVSEETKQKLRDYRLGRTHTPETIEKIRSASLALGSKPPPRAVGYKCSDEAKAKMRLNSPHTQKCEVDGVVYASFTLAGEALGIRSLTLRKRCLSDNFSNYKIVK